jgi:hypothetical protein
MASEGTPYWRGSLWSLRELESITREDFELRTVDVNDEVLTPLHKRRRKLHSS